MDFEIQNMKRKLKQFPGERTFYLAYLKLLHRLGSNPHERQISHAMKEPEWNSRELNSYQKATGMVLDRMLGSLQE